MNRAYENLPIWLQRILVDFWGRRVFRSKYGPAFESAYAKLAANESLDLRRLEEVQQRSLSRVLRHAKLTVPFYRSADCSPERLESWPIIDRASIRLEPAAFVSDSYRNSSLRESHTSGTTGTPLKIFYTDRTYQTEMAYRWRHKAWAGLALGARGAYLAGHPVVPRSQRRPPFWREDPAENRLLMSSYHMNRDTLHYYVKELERYRPEFLHGYPSSLYLLATAILENGVQLSVRSVFAASETLLAFQRRTLAKAFRGRIFNWYGQTEMTCNIVECTEGSLHLRTDYGYLEIDDSGGMICTGFTNEAMPLIRYRCGDVAAWSTRRCECGSAFPVIEEVWGRVEDYVVTAEGYLVGRLDHIFKDAEGVREAQIIQPEPGSVILRIARGNNYSRATEQSVVREAERRLGGSTRLCIEYVNAIERGPGGKFRFIVNQAPEELRRAGIPALTELSPH